MEKKYIFVKNTIESVKPNSIDNDFDIELALKYLVRTLNESSKDYDFILSLAGYSASSGLSDRQRVFAKAIIDLYL